MLTVAVVPLSLSLSLPQAEVEKQRQGRESAEGHLLTVMDELHAAEGERDAAHGAMEGSERRRRELEAVVSKSMRRIDMLQEELRREREVSAKLQAEVCTRTPTHASHACLVLLLSVGVHAVDSVSLRARSWRVWLCEDCAHTVSHVPLIPLRQRIHLPLLCLAASDPAGKLCGRRRQGVIL